jgi:hypothetical protein
MLWTIPFKNTPGVFLPENASGPLRSWAEIFPQNRRDPFRCVSVKLQVSSTPHQGPERGEGWKKQNPVEIPRTSDLPPRN